MRGFYLILGTFAQRVNGDWPTILDLQTWIPIEWRMGCAITAGDIPAQAKNAIHYTGSPSLPAYDIAAYRVTGPTTAELVWHKPEGHERGRWVRREK